MSYGEVFSKPSFLSYKPSLIPLESGGFRLPLTPHRPQDSHNKQRTRRRGTQPTEERDVRLEVVQSVGCHGLTGHTSRSPVLCRSSTEMGLRFKTPSLRPGRVSCSRISSSYPRLSSYDDTCLVRQESPPIIPDPSVKYFRE